MNARSATAAVGIVGSLLLSAALWWYFGTFVFFLFVPVVPFLFGQSAREADEQAVRECPACGFHTRNDAYDYCPRDGTQLEARR